MQHNANELWQRYQAAKAQASAKYAVISPLKWALAKRN